MSALRFAPFLLVASACALGANDDGRPDPYVGPVCTTHLDCGPVATCNLVTQRCAPAYQPNDDELVAEFACTVGSGTAGGTAHSAFRFGSLSQDEGGLCFAQRLSPSYVVLSIFSGAGRHAITVEFDPTGGTGPRGIPNAAFVYVDDFKAPEHSVAYATGGHIQIDVLSDEMIRGSLLAGLAPALETGANCSLRKTHCGSIAIPTLCYEQDPTGVPTCRRRCVDGGCGSGEACVNTPSGLDVCAPTTTDDGTCDTPSDCEGQICAIGQLGDAEQGYCRERCDPNSPARCGPGLDVCLLDASMTEGACIPNPCSLGTCEAGFVCDPTSYTDAVCVAGGVLRGSFDTTITARGDPRGTGTVSGTIPGFGAWRSSEAPGAVRVQSRDGDAVVLNFVSDAGVSMNIAIDPVHATSLRAGDDPRTFVVKWDARAGLVRQDEGGPTRISSGVSGTLTFMQMGPTSGSNLTGSFEIAFEAVTP